MMPTDRASGVVAHLRSASAWTSATPHALSAALRVSGVTINSASPTRLRLFPSALQRCATTLPSLPQPTALRRCATTRNESVVKKIFRLIFYCIFSKQTLQLVIEAFSKMMLLLITNIIAYHIPVSELISQRTVLFCPSFEKREILIVVTKKLAGLHLNHPHKFRDRY